MPDAIILGDDGTVSVLALLCGDKRAMKWGDVVDNVVVVEVVEVGVIFKMSGVFVSCSWVSFSPSSSITASTVGVTGSLAMHLPHSLHDVSAEPEQNILLLFVLATPTGDNRLGVENC